jgi:ribosomal protein L12E/L44/L45/RPP1/RPP2
MKQNTEILNELEGISTAVAAIPKVNVYHVYDNYFKEVQKIVLATINNDIDFAVPNRYFENLTANILQKVKANDVQEELQKISATVANIGNKNVYVTPKNYFENLLYSPKTEAKVISISAAKRKVVKLAVAAVVTGLLGLGIFTFVQRNNTTTEKDNIASIIKEADKIITTDSFEKDFATLTDKDLEKFLEQNGENVDAAMVATSADKAELPDAMDYYLDENTLNNFLNENNLKN